MLRTNIKAPCDSTQLHSTRMIAYLIILLLDIRT